MRRAALAAAVAATLAACSGGPGGGAAADDLGRLVLSAGDLPAGYVLTESKAQGFETLAAQFPLLRRESFVAARQSLVAAGRGPLLVSVAVLLRDEAAASASLDAFREGYRTQAGPFRAQASEAPAPKLGEQAFAIRITSEASGWVFAWRAGRAVMLIQATLPDDVGYDLVASLAEKVADRSR